MSDTLTNDERSAQEVAAFVAEKPSSYFAYPDRAFSMITTWTGDMLASVIPGTKGKPYRSNLGDERQSFRAKGINGVTYSGTRYMGNGDYIRMRAVKS